MDRRAFLKGSLAAAGAVGLPTGARAQEPAPRGIPARPFGKKGPELPVFGMGGSALVDQWAASYGVTLPSRDDRAAMVRHAFDRGVRYFDTARIYAESESIMGKGLKGVRDRAFLATKVVSAADGVRRSVEESLKQLDTSTLDLVQIHSPLIELGGFDVAMKTHAELVKLRDEKVIRYIGLTTHVAFQTVHRMISTGGFDQVLLACGYFNKGMDTLLSHRNLEFRRMCLAKAHELGMAIVAMKVMGANVFGHNAEKVVPEFEKAAREKLPGAAIRYVLQDERISMLNIGVSVPDDVDRNVATLSGDLRFTAEDQLLLADFARKAYDSETFKKMKTV
jgi:aryl-alcohol dehydrogenase-like predicted oxidoreductase